MKWFMPRYGAFNAAIKELCAELQGVYSVETRDAAFSRDIKALLSNRCIRVSAHHSNRPRGAGGFTNHFEQNCLSATVLTRYRTRIARAI